MRSVTRRAHADDGAVLILTVLVLVSLLAVAAIAVDAARLMQERRELQNGADAAADAIARDCARGNCAGYGTTATDYADVNADDGRSAVEGICGSTPPGAIINPPMQPCANPRTVGLNAGYVRVATATGTRNDGPQQVPFTFGLVNRLMGGAGGQTVRAHATVEWGPPKSLTTFPLSISRCEWGFDTTNGTHYAPPPPYSPYPAENIIPIKGGEPAGPDCPQGTQSEPGNWDWLQDVGCQATTTIGADAPAYNGGSTGAHCDDEFDDLVGTVVYLPVYDGHSGPGATATYHIVGYSAFFLTGFNLNGNHDRNSIVTNHALPCPAQGNGNGNGQSGQCISGFFVGNVLINTPGPIGGPDLGPKRVQFVE